MKLETVHRMINETLDTLTLTNYQRAAVATVISAPTPFVARDMLKQNEKLATAANVLQQVGVLAMDDDQASLTDKGKQIAKMEYLIDDTGSITSDAQDLLQQMNPDQSGA